ncbi:MAG: DNA polymerase Y family protein, partial [Gemmatimonadota bacterium]
LGLESAVVSSLRLLEKPEQIAVDRREKPRNIRWRGLGIPVVSAWGPERLSGDWWNDGFSRDYWRCEGADGELLLYRDAEGWWMQGWYD